MASGPPPPGAHVGSPMDEEAKERLSDTSGEHESGRNQSLNPVTGKPVADLPGDKIELTEEDCMDELGFSFPEWKKWSILTVIFWIQVSMNFNTQVAFGTCSNNAAKLFLGVCIQTALWEYLNTFTFLNKRQGKLWSAY